VLAREPYFSFNRFLREKFAGQRVRKIPLNAGFPCPNKDGTISDQGCIFCDTYGSGPIKTFSLPLHEQIERAISGQGGVKYIAYFQAHSNTCAPLAVLRKNYEVIFSYPDIVGLFIGTRPDSIPDSLYPLLEELNSKIYLTIELGLQTIHEPGLKFLHRNHTYFQFLETFDRLKQRRIDTVVHLILGIPGETLDHMRATVKEMNRLKPAGVKFHLLHILKNTPLYDYYCREPFKLMEKDEYIELMIDLLERLDPGIVVHRLTGERDEEIFVAPRWALDKHQVIQGIRDQMTAAKTYQGRLA